VADEPDTFSLWDLPLHTPAQLVGFSATLQDRYQGRLQEFGFHTGEEISCLHQPGLLAGSRIGRAGACDATGR
jgi:hypothetical protein